MQILFLFLLCYFMLLYKYCDNVEKMSNGSDDSDNELTNRNYRLYNSVELNGFLYSRITINTTSEFPFILAFPLKIES